MESGPGRNRWEARDGKRKMEKQGGRRKGKRQRGRNAQRRRQSGRGQAEEGRGQRDRLPVTGWGGGRPPRRLHPPPRESRDPEGGGQRRQSRAKSPGNLGDGSPGGGRREGHCGRGGRAVAAAGDLQQVLLQGRWDGRRPEGDWEALGEADPRFQEQTQRGPRGATRREI